MALNYVSVILDLTDGEGNLVTFGSAQFVPSAILTDVPDGVIITQAPIQVPFTSGGSPSARLLATDNASPAPSGWTWGASFNIGGGITPYNFFLPAGPASFTATNASPAVFTWTPTSAFTAAGLGTLPNGTGVQLSGGSLPTGFTAATTYYVVASSGSTFQLAATPGGSAIASTSTGSGNVTVTQYNLSSLTPAGSVGVSSPFMLVPAGTPSAGMVPIATGSGEASAWGAPGAAALTRAAVQTSNYTASAGQIVPVDTTSGAVTVTLPNTPAAGTLIAVKMVTQGGTNTVTIACAGSDVFNKAGGPATGTLTLLSQGMLLEYNSGIWTVLADDLPLSQLDARYVELAGDLGGTTAAPKVVSVLSGRIPLASTSYIDLCTAWNNGSPVAAVTPSTALTVTFTSSSTTATVTSGTAPASGAIISDALPSGTTFTASGNTLTLSAAATAGGSNPAWAGQDATGALQAAVNYFSTQNTDGTAFFSRPGIYLLNGAQQSGTAQAYNYSGQVLFPARTEANGMVSVRIMGSGPLAGFDIPGAPNANGGTVLLSAATSGCIFDAIPAFTAAGVSPMTFFSATFQNIVIRAHTNPQLTAAVNGTALSSLRFFDTCTVETTAGGGSNASALTGSGFGVIFPVIYNMAVLHQTGDMQIAGYPTGLSYGEHFVAENILIQGCVNGIQPNDTGEGHSCKIQRCLIQGVTNAINSNFTNGRISGLFDIGDPGGLSTTLGYFVNDSQNRLVGTLEVAAVRYSGGDDAQLGVPVNGGQNLRLVPYVGSGGTLPYDTFTRLVYSSAAGMGTTDSTLHVWGQLGSNSIWQVLAAGQATGVASGSAVGLVKYNGGRASLSRTVRTVAALKPSGYSMWHLVGNVISGPNFNAVGNYLNVSISGGVIKIIKQLGGTQNQLAITSTGTASGTVSGTSVTGWAGTITPVPGMTVSGGGFTSGSIITGGVSGSSGSWNFTVSSSGTAGSQSLTLGFVAGGLTYTIDTVISNPLSAGGAWVITVMVNGYQAVTYTLTTSDTGGNSITQLADTEQRYTQDGFGLFNDTGTVISEFAVMPG